MIERSWVVDKEDLRDCVEREDYNILFEILELDVF